MVLQYGDYLGGFLWRCASCGLQATRYGKRPRRLAIEDGAVEEVALVEEADV